MALIPMVMLWASSLAFSSAAVNSREVVRGVWYAMNLDAGTQEEHMQESGTLCSEWEGSHCKNEWMNG